MFLGIDAGTSGVKAVITAADGRVLAQSQAPLSVQRPHPLWSEQDPESWWQACTLAVSGLDPALRRDVRGIGLAGQMHGATLLDRNDDVLRPAMLWNDGRSFAECRALAARVPELSAITGNIAMPGFTAPKLLWLARHEPGVFARIASVLLPKDYLRLRMTGEKCSDMSDAAGTLWLDVAARDWSDTLLAATGLSRAQMPRLVEGNALSGRLRAEVATDWGMGRVPVAGGGGDNAAGAVGVGVVHPGDALLSLGTSGVIFAVSERFQANPSRAVHSFCHCLPGLWHQMTVHLSAASCVDWAARQLGLSSPAAVFDLAAAVPAGAAPELFLPYLSGERTPYNNPHLRAGFLNLDNDTTPAKLAAATLEGVAMALADGLTALRDGGAVIHRLAVIGGGARSLHWGGILAASLDCDLIYLQGGEVGPALGAARLAQCLVDNADPADVCTAPPIARIVTPDPDAAARMRAKSAAFRAAAETMNQLNRAEEPVP